jgi:hypothetical protein
MLKVRPSVNVVDPYIGRQESPPVGGVRIDRIQITADSLGDHGQRPHFQISDPREQVGPQIQARRTPEFEQADGNL